MPHSYQGQVSTRVGAHPQLEDQLEVAFATIVNYPDGQRRTFRSIATAPADASHEELAEVFGEVARRSFLAAMEGA